MNQNQETARPGSGYTPHDYQRRAIQLMAREPAAGLLLDPG